MKKYIFLIYLLIFTSLGFSQEANVLTFSEYLGYVKTYHPIVKQANLIINESEAKLLQARGAFDPKLEVDYTRKKFKNTKYYDKLNTVFKIPTWYGIEFKGGFEDNSGKYLNPEATLPEDGLYSIGVSISLAKGLLMNERMATLKQAKLYRQQANADNELLVNETLYKAALSYFDWLQAYQEKQVYKAFLTNAQIRFKGIKRSYELGESPAIDTIEARITLNNRKLNLEKANLNYIKTSLQLSNYLWINDVPVEVQQSIIPDLQLSFYVDKALELDRIHFESTLIDHPKLQSLDYKSKSLVIEERLQKNNLLPKINLQYNFLNETPETLNTFNTNDYKAGILVSFPIFLRKERAKLKLTQYKLQAIDFEKQTTEVVLKNKLRTIQQEITSYENQTIMTNTIVSDYTTLLKGEERKFEIGESSLFLINSRESKLIENKLKVIKLENSLLKSKGKLFNTLGRNSIN